VPIELDSTAALARLAKAQMPIALALCYLGIFVLHRAMNPEMLRSEAGYYQTVAHASAAEQQSLLRSFWKTSSHGHYTPAAFTAEFYFTKYAGLRPNIWRARQLLLGGLLAFFVFGFVRAAASQTQVPRTVSNIFAAGVTLLFIAQPVARDILDVLFHGIQLVWMTMTMAVAWSFVRLPASAAKERLIWIIALLAYASMHVLGLGLGVVAGTLSVFGLLLAGIALGSFPEWRQHVGTIAAASIILLLLAGLHTMAMIALNNAAVPVGPQRVIDWRGLVGLIALSPVGISAGMLGLLSPTLSDDVMSAAWPFGVAAVLSIILFIGALFWRNQRRPSPRFTSALFVAVFSAVLLVTLVAMIAMRAIEEPSSFPGLYGFIAGARYVLPITMGWLGLAASVVILLRRRVLAFAALLSLIFGLSAVVAHFSYEARVRAKTARLHGASHLEVWRDVVQVAREARAAHLPVPNIPLQRLSLFGFVDLKFFEPILHQDMCLPENEHFDFIDWAECRNSRLDEYLANCPSLPKIAYLLDLPLTPSPTGKP
jgi:hypothetical protein